MRFSFPKDAKKNFRDEDSALYHPVVSSAINETNIQRVIVQILERFAKNGRVSLPRREGAARSKHLERLRSLRTDGPDIASLPSEQIVEVLDAWMTATLVRWIPSTKTSEQKIDFLRPTSAASFLTGFPAERSRLRGIDKRVFTAVRELEGDSAAGFHYFRERLLEPTPLVDGSDFSKFSPTEGPQLGALDSLDVTNLLALHYSQTFPPIANDSAESSRGGSDKISESVVALPNVNLPVGRDVIDLLSLFGSKHSQFSWASNEILSGLEAVVSLRMLQLPIRLSKQLERLTHMENPKIDDFSMLTNDAGMFVDFGSGRFAESKELSRLSVANHLIELQNLYSLLVQFKVTHRALDKFMETREAMSSMLPAQKLEYVARHLDSEKVSLRSSDFLDYLISTLDELNETELISYVREKKELNQDDFRTYVELLLENNGETALSGYRKWLYSTGNIEAFRSQKGVYYLAGVKSKPTTWSYVISDEALLAVISMCFVATDRNADLPRERMLVRELIDTLRQRFGILVEGAAESSDEILVKKGTEKNIVAFLDRLRLLGCYQGLSDDLEAQFVSIPGLPR